MAKQPPVFCDGPHAGPCPNRVVKLLRKIAKRGATYPQGCNAASILRQIVELGWGEEDLSCQFRFTARVDQSPSDAKP